MQAFSRDSASAANSFDLLTTPNTSTLTYQVAHILAGRLASRSKADISGHSDKLVEPTF
jgi:hypothetical protein